MSFIFRSHYYLFCSALFALAFLGGCIDLHQELTIKSATTGSFELLAKVPETVIDVVSQDTGYSRFLDPEKGAAYFNGHGITIRSYRVYKHNSKMRYIRIRGDITDMSTAMKSGRLGCLNLKPIPGGQRLEYTFTEKGLTSDKKVVAKAFKGLTLGLLINTPTSITSSSGKKAGSKQVLWEMDADKKTDFLTKSPTFFVEFK